MVKIKIKVKSEKQEDTLLELTAAVEGIYKEMSNITGKEGAKAILKSCVDNIISEKSPLERTREKDPKLYAISRAMAAKYYRGKDE